MAPRRENNIAWTLTTRAATDPGLSAVIAPTSHHNDISRRRYKTTTFAELEISANRLAHALLASGITPGTRAVLMVRPSLEFFSLTFAVFKAGIIPIFIDPGMGIRGLGHCIAESQATAFIGIPQAHFARRLFGWGRGAIDKFVMIRSDTRIRARTSRTFWHRIRLVTQPDTPPSTSVTDDQTAAILFTSGSTGPAKGVVYTHRVFNAQVRALQELLHITPGEVDLCTFPLFALFAPALGMTSVIPRMDFTRPGRVNPTEIIGPARRFSVTNLFGSPALLRRVQEYGRQNDISLPLLNRVVSAGAPVPADVIAGVKKLLRANSQVFTPYGATESLPVACIGSDEILGETAARTARGRGVCVGKPVAGMTVRIIPVTDDPIPALSQTRILPAGEVGEIVVSAEQVTQAYDARPEANAKAKIADDSQPGSPLMHRMGDLGYLDTQGRLWFCGRKAHRVHTAQGPLDTITTEAIFNQHRAVFRTALVGIGEKGHQKPVICVELRPGLHHWFTIEQELAAMATANTALAQITNFLLHNSFPVDIRHNSKIFREKLAVWAAERVPQ
ncbi:MAG: fatty acid CoA ligase family protein [bacterium]